jgi:hypothetical protein
LEYDRDPVAVTIRKKNSFDLVSERTSHALTSSGGGVGPGVSSSQSSVSPPLGMTSVTAQKTEKKLSKIRPRSNSISSIHSIQSNQSGNSPRSNSSSLPNVGGLGLGVMMPRVQSAKSRVDVQELPV